MSQNTPPPQLAPLPPPISSDEGKKPSPPPITPLPPTFSNSAASLPDITRRKGSFAPPVMPLPPVANRAAKPRSSTVAASDSIQKPHSSRMSSSSNPIDMTARVPSPDMRSSINEALASWSTGLDSPSTCSSSSSSSKKSTKRKLNDWLRTRPSKDEMMDKGIIDNGDDSSDSSVATSVAVPPGLIAAASSSAASSSSNLEAHSPRFDPQHVIVQDTSGFSTKPAEAPQWDEKKSSNDESKTLVSLNCLEKNYKIEFGDPNAPANPPLCVEHHQLDRQFYQEFFLPYSHVNFAGTSDTLGPVIISVRPKSKQVPSHHVIVRSAEGDDRFLLAASVKRQSFLKAIQSVKPQLSNVKFVKSTSQETIQSLVQFEQDQICNNYKFGVLLVGSGQTEENDMFGNIDGNAAYEKFLAWLGKRVRLLGWQDFRGGLDVKQDSTGTHSIYAKFFTYQIMYHVSTLLPFHPADPQQLERKRHLGNDIVVIVFLENPNDTFSPLKMASHYNHVYFVMASHPDGYQLQVVNKDGVPPYGPAIPSPPVIPANEKGRQFLMTKLINAERSATIHAPAFKVKTNRTRNALLKNYVREITEKHSSKSKSMLSKGGKLVQSSSSFTKLLPQNH
mmetsp:Transcript_1807/g.2576  ORF Transcript_1807/g.2576 Transcript_1807/m.2576 type:complete len:618 (-) Transcript_1807:22-1875(-)